MRRSNVWVWCAVVLLGCPATTVVNGITVRADAWSEAEQAVRARARSQLECEQPELTLREVHPAGSPTVIDVSGCGDVVTFVPDADGWRLRP